MAVQSIHDRGHATRAVIEPVASAADVYVNSDLLPGRVFRLIENGKSDWIALSISSIARLITPASLEQIGRTVKLAANSPVTAEAAREVGLPIAVVAETFTWEGLFEAISQTCPMSGVAAS